MEGTHRAGLMSASGYAHIKHIKNLNVTDSINEYAFKNTNATLKLYLILVSLVQSVMPLDSLRAQQLRGTFPLYIILYYTISWS